MAFVSTISALLLAASPAEDAAPMDQAPAFRCDIGPLHKAYGGSQWLLYSCTDGTTLAMVSAPGSPAMPYYFMFQRHGVNYRIQGEGTGSKDATDAAYHDLATLSASDVEALIAQTKTVTPAP